MKIGILAALEAELNGVAEALAHSEIIKTPSATFIRGFLKKHEMILCRCGVGKVNAAMCAQHLIDQFHPQLILNTGVAGALVEGLEISDAVIAGFAVEHDIDTTGFGDPKGLVPGLDTVRMLSSGRFVDTCQAAAQALKMHYVVSGIATGDQFISRQADKRALANAFGCAACDMEGGAIAQVCAVNHVPYAAIRTISDTFQGSEEEFSVNLQRAAEASVRLTQTFLTLLE